MFNRPTIEAIDKRIDAKMAAAVLIDEARIVAVPPGTRGVAQIQIRSTPELKPASFDPDATGVVAGRACLVAKAPSSTQYVIIGVFARNNGLTGSQPIVIAPPGSIGTITGLYGLSLIHWDAPPTTSACFQIQTSATGTEGDAVNRLITRGSYYVHSGTSAFYFRIRSISQDWHTSSWTAWQQVTPESAALAAYIQANAYYRIVRKAGVAATQRPSLNFIDGTGISIAVTDDGAKTDVTITSTTVATFLGLTDTPGSFSGQAGKVAVVNGTEDALEFITAAGVTTFLALTDTPASYSGYAGYVPIVNVGESAIEWVDGSTLGGAVAATDLTDGPGSYTGAGSKIFAVKATADGFEFVDKSTIGSTTFLGLTDTPSSFASANGYYLKVNGAGNAVEFSAYNDDYTPVASEDWPAGDPASHSSAIDDLAERTVGRFVYFEQGSTSTVIEGTGGTNIVTLSPNGSNLLENTNGLWDGGSPTELAVDHGGLWSLWMWLLIEKDGANDLNNWFRVEVFNENGDTLLVRDTYIGAFFWADFVVKHYFDPVDVGFGEYFWIRLTNFSTEDSHILYRLSWNLEAPSNI